MSEPRTTGVSRTAPEVLVIDGGSTGEDRCEAATCNRVRRRDDVVCNLCMQAIIGMCRGKQRIDPYTARRRGERTGRGWYHCLACGHSHQTRARPGPGAHVIRARAAHAIAALIKHHGDAWFADLVSTWDPVPRATPRSSHTG